MALSDWQVNIGGEAGGVTMGKGTSYLIMDFAFFGQSNHRTLDTPRGNRSGDFTSKDYFGSRVGTIKVTIQGTDAADAMNLYNTLIAQWWVRDTEDSRPLLFKFPGQPEQQMVGKPRRWNPDFAVLKSGIVHVDLEYYNPEPAILSASENSSTVGLSNSGSGRTYPRVYPMTYGAVTPNDILVTNAGNYTTYPVITIYGPCQNPIIENLTQDKWIKLDLTLDAGEWVEIDTAEHSILLDGTASRRSAMTADSRWWTLDPGDTSIRFLADTYQATASAVVSFYDAWLG